MKIPVYRIAQLAVGVVVLGGMAYGQNVMKAEIPFAFQVSNTTLPAGNYTLFESRNSSLVNIRLWNAASGRTVLTAAGPLDIYTEGKGRLTFECDGQKCSLSQIRNAQGTVSYLPARRTAQEKQVASVVSIPLAPAHGD